MDEGHMAYWEFFPTIDHKLPLARGGLDEESNWVSCSMLSNSIKANWTLEEIGWCVLEGKTVLDWDGMMHWYIEQVERESALMQIPYLKRWHGAALYVLKDVGVVNFSS